MKGRAVLLGGHHKTISLAQSLLESDFDVVAVTSDELVATEMSRVRGLTVLLGDMCEIALLDQAGTAEASVVIALSNSDAQNLVACQLAKIHFHVPRTVSIVSDAKKVPFFERMGVDAPVSVAHVIAMMLEDLL